MRGQSSGQAVVEYILLVTIAVSLIFILKGAFKSTQEFIDNYLGTYTACLMEHGELPSLGVREEDLKQHLSSDSKCETQYKAFSLAEGRPPIASNSPTARAGGGGDKSDSASSSSSAAAESSSKSSKNDKANIRGRSSPYEDGTIATSGRGTADGYSAAAPSKTKLIEDEEGIGDEYRRSSRQSRVIYRQRQKYKAISGKEAEKLMSTSSRSTIKRTPISRTIAKEDEDSAMRFGPRTAAFVPPPKKVIIEEEKAENWSFGSLFKWLIIIAIIIVLVIFFGGQILSYSNSDS